MIRVAVADDQALVRAGFCVLLGTAHDFEEVGEAADGDAAVDLVVRERPDVILMDTRMPGLNGGEATERITADKRLAATQVLIVTTFDLDEYVFDALRAGASGFLLPSIVKSQESSSDPESSCQTSGCAARWLGSNWEWFSCC